MKLFNIFAIFIGLLLAAAGFHPETSHTDANIFFTGAIFFISLAILGHKNDKDASGGYIYIAIAVPFLSYSLMGLVSGSMRFRTGTVRLATDPNGFVFTLSMLAILGAGLLCYGVYKLRKHKTLNATSQMGSKSHPVNTLMEDLDSAGKLIIETSMASQLEHQSRLLFSELENKYKLDSFAITYIQTSKNFISKEIKKRKLNENTAEKA